ncbi:MAG: hypothetical protein AAGU27_01480 [Dehalobacterium sp.]
MGTFKLYGEFFRKSFQRAAVYRFDAWTRVISNVMFLFMCGDLFGMGCIAEKVRWKVYPFRPCLAIF